MESKCLIVLAVFIIGCSNGDNELDLPISNINNLQQEIFFRSMTTPLECMNQDCYLNGEYWVHNDDEDACNNVSVTIDEFVCEGCTLDSYSIVLNTNGADQSVGPVLIGQWQKNSLSSWAWKNEYSPPPLIYSGPPGIFESVSDPSIVTQLAAGETITFEYWTSYVSDIEFCIYFNYRCQGEYNSSACCGVVDFACI